MKLFQLATLLFFITTCIWFKKTNDLRQENANLMLTTKSSLKALRSKEMYLSERLTVYYLITLEQNKVIEKYKSSRNEKLRNKKLMDLQQKLN